MSAEVPDLIRRAGELLAREAPARAPLDPVQHRIPSPVAPAAVGAAALAELRTRALALIDDVYACLAARAEPAPAPGTAAAGRGAAAVPLACPPAAVAAGRVATISLEAENTTAAPVSTGCYSTDLLGDAGWSIPGYLVSFDPPRLLLAPGQRAVITARIDVPLQTTPGAYAGLVQAIGLPAQKLVLSIEVA
jgi:hypothetical protein